MIEKKLTIPSPTRVPRPSMLKPAPMPTAAPTRPMKVPGPPKPLGEEDPQILEKALMLRMKQGQNC